MKVGIYIYENAEVLDFSGPFEVFATASRFLKKSEQLEPFLISQEEKTVCARGGYKVLAQHNFKDAPLLDVLIVVGGVHTQELLKEEVLTWVKEQASRVKLVASVCTGAFILAQAGVLTNQKVTTHWEDIEDLQKSFPLLEVVGEKRWVDTGRLVTSGGISAGIDMSLHLVSKLISHELAQKTAKQMEFDWQQNS